MSIGVSAMSVGRTPCSDARRFAFLLLALCSLALAQRAAAQAADARQGYALNWVRAPGAEACISSSQLAERVEQLLGPVLRAPDASDRAVEGLVSPAGSGFTVQIRMGDRAGTALGERSFGSEAAACSELDDSIVLVLALMIDPSAGERGLPPELLGMLDDAATPAADLLADLERERVEEAPAAAAAPAPAKARHAPVPPKPREQAPEPPDSKLGLEIALVPALSYGNQPNIAPGFGLNARIDAGAVRFELAGSLWAPSEVALEQADQRALTEFKSANATLALCVPIVQLARLAFAACAGAAFVARWFESSGLINTPQRTRSLFGPSLGADIRYALSSRFFALASATALAMFPEENFFYTDGESNPQTLYEPPVIGAIVGLGIGASL